MLSPEHCSDDTLRVALDERHDCYQRAAIAEHLRNSGAWVECVEGMHSIVVQFDASTTTHVAAMLELKEQLANAPAAPGVYVKRPFVPKVPDHEASR